MRSYSIASSPSASNVIELAVERLPDGEVSPFFHDIVAVGDEIELRGPIGGHFLWPERATAPVLLIGAGSGVVPLMAMIRQRHALAARKRVVKGKRVYGRVDLGGSRLIK